MAAGLPQYQLPRHDSRKEPTLCATIIVCGECEKGDQSVLVFGYAAGKSRVGLSVNVDIAATAIRAGVVLEHRTHGEFWRDDHVLAWEAIRDADGLTPQLSCKGTI